MLRSIHLPASFHHVVGLNAALESALSARAIHDSAIVDIQVERREYTLASMGTQTEWVLFDEATEAEEAEWCCEIMEAINQEFIDNMGEQ